MSREGRLVLITGANSGIGKALALHFAKLGATLSLTDHADYVIRYTINRFGKLDVLINNAGVYELGGIENTTVEQFDRIFDNNVKSMYLLTMYAVPYLAKTNGTVINISSLAGLRPFRGILAYCMSKAAVDQFTKCLALELAPKNIRVNSVNPSVVDTGIHITGGMDPEKYKKYIKESRKKHPLKRITTVEDIVEAVAFLASDKAKFITGVNFPVDGGRSICPS
ncbi:putative oxidoreductase TM_0325 [Lycorma delicatula]|uniref:putative oxidoreductase TM_0325 n=1 Tax=Lycorma delicatula TaxID=130591 RepID=UPI003F5146D1